jgi:hypothetical protein
MDNIHLIIKKAAQKRILYTTHALKQMNSEKRLILTKEIENKIFNGHIIENYPKDKRGKSCLINGKIDSRPVHVVCAPKDEYLAIITAYIPEKNKWNKEFTKRKS